MVKYKNLRILVADDFSNFRTSVCQMLAELGVVEVHTASSAEETVESCVKNTFDVVLCDYNLGVGRSGQHVLEELRFRRGIDHRSLFIILSAETSRSIVMSAYDSQPDDYMMKPINSNMLGKRLARLLKQREALKPIYSALCKGNTPVAVDLLIDLSLSESRFAVPAQKMLGEQFIAMGELDKAERVYTKALEARPLDWARLGLAKVKQLRGELDIAGSWLEKIVSDSPLYLPAYDVLADNWERLGENKHMQAAVQRSVDISPMSILRQQRLADVAHSNNDIATALEALRRAVKLGELSCYGCAEDHFDFARIAASAAEQKMDLPAGTADEALQVLQNASQRFALTPNQMAQFKLLSSRVHMLENHSDAADQLFEEAEALFSDQTLGIDADIERIATLLSRGKKSAAKGMLAELQEYYIGDQSALEKIDCFLNEPVSESNIQRIAQINQEGIVLHNNANYDDALQCFEKARKLFPKHVGIQLNIVQSLIGKMKLDTANQDERDQCFAALTLVDSLIDEQHPQFDRYSRLKVMAKNIKGT